MFAAPAAATVTSSGDTAGASELALPAVSSVFSSDAPEGSTWGSAGGLGQFDLPFTYNGGAGEPIVYTASADADWLLLAGVASDDWFFV